MPHLFLIEGFPGAGKSFLGKELKAALGPNSFHLIDADDITQPWQIPRTQLAQNIVAKLFGLLGLSSSVKSML